MLLEVSHLKKSFKNGRVRAVDDVSLHVKKNETLGLVGESGSGKSILAKLILGVLPTDEGEVSFHGASMGAVFQDPPLIAVKTQESQIFLLRPSALLNRFDVIIV